MFSLRLLQIVWLLAPLVACSERSPLDGLARGEEGRVVRVFDGDSIALDTGLSVRLVGIEAPSFGRNDDLDQAYAKEAQRHLEDLVLGRQVRLYYPGMTRDRYDRALAHIETADGRGPKVWINRELIRRGAARVRIYPDTAAMADDLLTIERTAREESTGLWEHSDYAPKQASDLEWEFKGFVLIEGRLADPVPTDRPGQLCAFEVQGAGLRLIADATAPQLCELSSGTGLRVRGYTTNGRLYITHSANIELISEISGR